MDKIFQKKVSLGEGGGGGVGTNLCYGYHLEDKLIATGPNSKWIHSNILKIDFIY